MADIAHEIKVRATRETVFAALSTREGMQGWHTAHVAGDGSVGSTWKFDFPGHPSFTWEIVASEPENRVEWRCAEGPGDSVGTKVEYRLSDTGDGRTLVEQVHSGWESEGGSYRKCNTLWGVLLHHLQQYAETNTAAPAYS